jgi:hypothetical protein
VLKRVGDLELDQDLAFQHREWAVQRVSRWVLTAFTIGAALGAFGGGPLTGARAGSPGSPVWIEFDRVVRVNAPARLSVHVRGPAHGHSTRDIRIAREYFERFRVERITPEPATVALDSDDVTLSLPAQGVDQSTVVLDVQPLVPGLYRARVGAGAAGAVTFTQLVLF